MTDEKRGVGRPSKATPQVLDELCAIVARVGFRNVCARKVGIGERTLTEWLDRGERGDEPFGAFRARFLAAQAEWEINQIERATATDPRWSLERVRPSEYGRPAEGVQVNVQTNVAAITAGELEKARLALLADLRRDPMFLAHIEDDEPE